MHSSQSCAPPRRRRSRNAGFSIIEIMIVVVIISLLAMLALPAFNRIKRASQSARFVTDLRVFAQAYEGFIMLNGSFPPTTGAGVVPIGMGSDQIKTNVWDAVNSIGGRWNWENNGTGTAGIATSGVTAPFSQMVKIDSLIDDGDLTNGLFQQVNPTTYIYLMTQ